MQFKTLFSTILLALVLSGNQSAFSEEAQKKVDPFDPIENLKRLGSDTFSPEAWENSGAAEKGRMIWSFFQQHPLSELTLEKVRELLGPSTVTSADEYSPINSGLWPAYALGGPEEITVPHEGWSGYTLIFVFNPWDPNHKEIMVVPTMLP